MKENENNIYPGYNEHSFGFISTGEIIWQNEKKPYFSFPPRNELFVTFKTLGIMVDMYAGSISLVFDKKIQNVAFGSGARAYDSKDQLRQKCASIKDFKTNHIIREIILNSMMVPMFAMQAPLPMSNDQYSGDYELQANFGKSTFVNSIEASPYESLLQHEVKGKFLYIFGFKYAFHSTDIHSSCSTTF
ncbi:hypothetical protein HDU84_006002 [Entophlyctis sp. JEL0112]|nr:hypothetical protein HDU84_006002 [Entophlyctis sp. JEL0112]